MIGRRPRAHSQRNYLLIQQIRAENARQNQIDAGLGYRRHATEHGLTLDARPLYIGPQIEMTPVGKEWNAA